MNGIWRESKMMWKKQEGQFMIKGKDCKAGKLVDNIDLNKFKKWFELLELSTQLLAHYGFPEKRLKRIFTILLQKINKKKVIVFCADEIEWENTRILILKDSDISDYLPAVSCPIYKPMIKKFNQKNKLIIAEYVNKLLKEKQAVILTKKNDIEVYSVFSPIYELKDEKNEIPQI